MDILAAIGLPITSRPLIRILLGAIITSPLFQTITEAFIEIEHGSFNTHKYLIQKQRL